MLNKLSQRIQRAIEEKVFPGCVLAIIHPLHEKTVIPFGTHTYENNSPRITRDSIFDVASITKAIPTSSLALKLIDEKKISLDDCLIKFVPEFNNIYKDQVLIKHLLTQTLNYNFRLSSLKDLNAEGILNAIYTSEFLYAPGKSFFYSNATSILLGIIVERVYNQCLAEIAASEFFKPLGMQSTSFFAENFKNESIVPTEIDPWRNRIIQGEIHDESAYVLRNKMVAGSAGLFSTAPDIMLFLEMILNQGVMHDRIYFSPNILMQMQTNQIFHLGLFAGLGWELFQKRYMGKYCTEKTIGKTGFTGCVCVADVQQQKAFVLLSNYTYPQRKKDSSLLDSVRSDIADIILSS
jgi:CubicO group peptidase (beta-lactamase class C family)